MAVRFEKDRFVIVVETICPIDDWLTLCKSLSDIIRNVNDDTIVDETFYASIDFLQHLLPEWEEAKKMSVK